MGTTAETATAIRPFQVDVAQEDLDDLRRRIAATRWPDKELVTDRSQGVQLAATQELARYWVDDYDFGRVETRLNALPRLGRVPRWRPSAAQPSALHSSMAHPSTGRRLRHDRPPRLRRHDRRAFAPRPQSCRRRRD